MVIGKRVLCDKYLLKHNYLRPMQLLPEQCYFAGKENTLHGKYCVKFICPNLTNHAYKYVLGQPELGKKKILNMYNF